MKLRLSRPVDTLLRHADEDLLAQLLLYPSFRGLCKRVADESQVTDGDDRIGDHGGGQHIGGDLPRQYRERAQQSDRSRVDPVDHKIGCHTPPQAVSEADTSFQIETAVGVVPVLHVGGDL